MRLICFVFLMICLKAGVGNTAFKVDYFISIDSAFGSHAWDTINGHTYMAKTDNGILKISVPGEKKYTTFIGLFRSAKDNIDGFYSDIQIELWNELGKSGMPVISNKSITYKGFRIAEIESIQPDIFMRTLSIQNGIYVFSYQPLSSLNKESIEEKEGFFKSINIITTKPEQQFDRWYINYGVILRMITGIFTIGIVFVTIWKLDELFKGRKQHSKD
jgi:hypothetical protein